MNIKDDVGIGVLEINDRVMIYEDPITRKIQEGEAVLVELENQLVNGYQCWSVHFDNDSPTLLYTRILHPDDKFYITRENRK